MVTRSVMIQTPIGSAVKMIPRLSPGMDTIHTKSESEISRRQKLYGVFGFSGSQFQTQGETICAQDAIDESVFLLVIGIARSGYFCFLSLLGTLICEMNFGLSDVGDVIGMGGGRRWVVSEF